MRRLIVIAALCFTTNQPDVLAAVVEVENFSGESPLNDHVEIYKDITGKLKFSDIQSRQHLFRPNPTPTMNFGVTSNAYWFRVTLRNRGADEVRPYLEVRYPFIQEIDVFVLADGNLQHSALGERFRFDQRQFEHVDFVVRVRVPANSDVQVYVRLWALAPAIFPISLIDDAVLVRRVSNLQLQVGLLFGSLIIIAAFGVLVCIRSREWIYASYALYVSAHIPYFARYYGFGFQHVWGKFPLIQTSQIVVMSVWAAVYLATIGFARCFLQSRVRAPRLDLLLRAALLACLAIVPVALVASRVASVVYVLVIGWTYPLVLLATAVVIHSRGYRPARLFMAAFGVYLVAMVLVSMSLLGVLPSFVIRVYAQPIAMVVQISLLGFALGDRARDLQRQSQSLEKSLVQARAIAQTTQMLAHDVRAPMSLIKNVLEMLRATDDPEDLRALIEACFPEVQRSLRSADQLIKDVLEIGSSEQLEPRDVDLTVAVRDALVASTHCMGGKTLELRYDWNHRHFWRADPARIERALVNLISNAAEANPVDGAIWFHTWEENDRDKTVIALCIGNFGERISSDDLPRLFDPFFTKGKKNGTGLGLSIAQNIIESHDGTLQCTRTSEAGTEFVVRIPGSSSMVMANQSSLPTISTELMQLMNSSVVDSGAQAEERALEQEIIRRCGGAPVFLVVVDDEESYQERLSRELRRADLAGLVQVSGCARPSESLKLVETVDPVAVVVDVDLRQEQDGFELAATLRSQGYRGLVCIHSNRGFLKYHKFSQESGADLFIPKPMSRVHLLRLLISALNRRIESRQFTHVSSTPP